MKMMSTSFSSKLSILIVLDVLPTGAKADIYILLSLSLKVITAA